MRILFLTHRLPYAPNRGDRLRAWYVLRHLSARHEITVVSLVHDEDEMGHVADLEGVVSVATGIRTPRLRNLLGALAAFPTGRPLTHVLLASPAMVPALSRLVATSPPDVVLAYCSGMARFALQPPLDRFPLVIDMVDADSAKWTALASASSLPLRLIYRREAWALARFEASAMRLASATVMVNEREHAALSRLAPDANLVIVRNGIDVERFRPPDMPSVQLSVVFCGVMDYAPNEAGAIWLARDVWPLVRESEPSATLFLVGASPTKAITALASDTGGVHVTGTVDDVRGYLWSAAAAAAPLKTARGVQNKVLEAVAAGLPVVVTHAVWDGLPEAVRPACHVADSTADFAAAILELFRLGPAARRRRASAASLSSLGWEPQVSVLEGVLAAAARRFEPVAGMAACCTTAAESCGGRDAES